MVCGSDPGASKSVAVKRFGMDFHSSPGERNSFKINVWGGIRVPKISEEKETASEGYFKNRFRAFSSKGYYATSIDDITRGSGYQQGIGIYLF